MDTGLFTVNFVIVLGFLPTAASNKAQSWSNQGSIGGRICFRSNWQFLPLFLFICQQTTRAYHLSPSIFICHRLFLSVNKPRELYAQPEPVARNHSWQSINNDVNGTNMVPMESMWCKVVFKRECFFFKIGKTSCWQLAAEP